MERVAFKHGGPELDSRYPEGIPTVVDAELTAAGAPPVTSGLVMFPGGHARYAGSVRGKCKG